MPYRAFVFPYAPAFYISDSTKLVPVPILVRAIRRHSHVFRYVVVATQASSKPIFDIKRDRIGRLFPMVVPSQFSVFKAWPPPACVAGSSCLHGTLPSGAVIRWCDQPLLFRAMPYLKPRSTMVVDVFLKLAIMVEVDPEKVVLDVSVYISTSANRSLSSSWIVLQRDVEAHDSFTICDNGRGLLAEVRLRDHLPTRRAASICASCNHRVLSRRVRSSPAEAYRSGRISSDLRDGTK